MAIGTLILFAAAPASADLALDVQPARYEFQVSAGGSQTVPITIRNAGTAPVHVVATVNDFTVNQSGTYAFLAPGSIKWSAGKWVSINPREFDLPPGTFQQIRYSVDVPQGVAGEYSSLIFFTTRPTRKPGAFGVAERVGSKIYVLVNNTAKINGEITDLATRPYAGGQQYSVNFKNTGNLHLYLNGHVDVKQGGSLVDQIQLPKDTLVERGGIRVIEGQGKRLAPGSYQAVAVVDYGGSSLVAGQTAFVVH
jgi:urease beta subunit